MDGVKKQRHHQGLLPVELMYLIFSKIDNKNDRDSFGLTCHSFLEIQNSMRKHLQIVLPFRCYIIHAITNGIIGDLLDRFTQLKSLSFKNYNVTDVGLDYVGRGCPLLSVITLYRCYSITDNGLKLLTNSCKLLTLVDLGECFNITDYGVGYVIRSCRQLRALRIISGCKKITGEGFVDCSPTLAFLEAKDCAFSETSVSALLSGGGLNYLNLSSPVNYGWGDGLGVVGLGFGKNIKVLDFKYCRGVGDDDVIKISKGCLLLQEWNLSFCHEIKLSGWQSVGLYCQNLEILHVNKCTYLCDTGLLALANGCRRLSLIYLIKGRKITSSGISSFKKCRQDVDLKLDVEEEHITTTSAFTA